jgi:hypothetical protein
MEAVFTEFQKLNGTTWFYLSTLLAVAVFFRFNRFFCLRNWDLITLCLLVPGLLATARVDKRMLQVLEETRTRTQVTSSAPPQIELAADNRLELYYGYLWLFVGTGYLCLRCFIDLFLARRPRLPPNLDVAGLCWLGSSLLAFLFFEAVTKEPDPAGRASAVVAASLLNGNGTPSLEEAAPGLGPINPSTTYYMGGVHLAMDKFMQVIKSERFAAPPSDVAIGVARSGAILAHLFILAGLIVVGAKHFGSAQIGVGMATLYLLTPLTAINIAKIDQLLPSALLLWAVVFHRQPRIAGALLGVSCAFLFPIFLVPLWLGFYGTRGAARCFSGIVVAGSLMALLFILSDSARDFLDAWASSVVWRPEQLGVVGQTMSFWTETTHIYRLPIFVAYVFLVLGVAFWPVQKNLAELIALSVLLILGVQFWYPHRGGTFVHWYLPLFLLMMFRPNLQNALPPDPEQA